MSIILVAMTALYIIIMLFTYSNIFRVVLAHFLIYGLLIMTFFYGFRFFQSNSEIEIFGKMLNVASFYALSGGWLIFNLIATVKIIKSFNDYKRVNSKG